MLKGRKVLFLFSVEYMELRICTSCILKSKDLYLKNQKTRKKQQYEIDKNQLEKGNSIQTGQSERGFGLLV
jgi:hypothetical protein